MTKQFGHKQRLRSARAFIQSDQPYCPHDESYSVKKNVFPLTRPTLFYCADPAVLIATHIREFQSLLNSPFKLLVSVDSFVSLHRGKQAIFRDEL